MNTHKPFIIIGAGFTGLSCAYELTKAGIPVVVYDKADEIGGLAGSFKVGDVDLEKFYHHWFTNDQNVVELIEELGRGEDILIRGTRTGMYFANNFYKLSSPLDLLKFKALPFIDRIRLGLLTLRARRVKDWMQLEDITAEEWLTSLGGAKVYEIVWKPLLEGKFGRFSSRVSAVWFWNKLKLRGGSRGKKGEENLAYFRGGFAKLAEYMADAIETSGLGEIKLGCPVESILERSGTVEGIVVDGKEVIGAGVLATVHLPQFAEMLPEGVDREYRSSLEKIDYIGNVCLVLILDRSLSDLYWINVNEPDFPYVGVIEHTNFEPKDTYEGKHIVYLSKYLPTDEELYRMSPSEVLEYSIPYITRMFPDFEQSWIMDYKVWREPYSQPVVGKSYSKFIPPFETPINKLYLATMAQIYPEDRGTNYAIREGRKAAKILKSKLGK